MSGASECFDNRDAVYLGTSHLWDTFVTLGLELDAAVQVVLWWQLAEVLSLQKLLPWENGWCASKCWLESSVFSKERDGKSTCWCIWQSLGNALDAPKVYIYIEVSTRTGTATWTELSSSLAQWFDVFDHELRRFSQIIHPTHTSRQGQVRSDFFWCNMI